MSTAQAAPDLRLLAPDFAARFSAIITQLIGFIVRSLGRDPRLAALMPRFCNRLIRSARIIRSTMARLAAGKRPRIDPRRNRIRARSPSARLPLPASPGWLLRALKHDAAATRIHLEALLATPGMAGLLAEAPALPRLLTPLRRALAIGFEGRPAKPPPPPVAPKPPAPKPLAPSGPPSQTGPRPHPAPRPARFVSFVRVL